MSKVMDLAEALGQAIEEDEAFVQYRQAKEQYDQDEPLQQLISEYNLKKMAVMNHMSGNSSEADDTKLKQLQDELHAAYDDVVRNPVMAAFMQAQEQMEKMVSDVYGVINFHVTGEQPGSCTGSCSTCGGCH